MVWILSELYFCLWFPKDNQAGLSRQCFLEERFVGRKHHLQHVQTSCCSMPRVTTGTTDYCSLQVKLSHSSTYHCAGWASRDLCNSLWQGWWLLVPVAYSGEAKSIYLCAGSPSTQAEEELPAPYVRNHPLVLKIKCMYVGNQLATELRFGYLGKMTWRNTNSKTIWKASAYKQQLKIFS